MWPVQDNDKYGFLQRFEPQIFGIWSRLDALPLGFRKLTDERGCETSTQASLYADRIEWVTILRNGAFLDQISIHSSNVWDNEKSKSYQSTRASAWLPDFEIVGSYFHGY